jgi:F-type H+-transporting ATPase subunit gamma
MANLLDIRRRIKSVKNTQQVTKAMKMVSAAKLRRAQERVINARPFAAKMRQMLENLASQTSEDFHHPLLDARGDQRYRVFLITSDKGLCGGFNANLIKAAQVFLKEHADKDIELVTIGRKGRDFFRRQRELAGEFIGLTGKGSVSFQEAVHLARERLINRFTEDEGLDKVFVIFSEFKSVIAQRVVVEQLLPIAQEKEESEPDAAGTRDYIFEQPPAEIFGRLLPRMVEMQIYRALLESIASEQGARMTAMEAATKNAGELISSLTLNMNRVRQAAITREIIEIVSGAAAL